MKFFSVSSLLFKAAGLMPAGWNMGVSVGLVIGLIGPGALVFCGSDVLVAAGFDVLLTAGCDVLVAAGCDVLVAAGCDVLVAAGCDVLVTAGCDVLVAAGCDVLVAADCEVLVAADCEVLVAAGCEGKFLASKVSVAAGAVAFSSGVLTTELFFGVNKLHPVNTGSNTIKHKDKYKIAFRRCFSGLCSGFFFSV